MSTVSDTHEYWWIVLCENQTPYFGARHSGIFCNGSWNFFQKAPLVVSVLSSFEIWAQASNILKNFAFFKRKSLSAVVLFDYPLKYSFYVRATLPEDSPFHHDSPSNELFLTAQRALGAEPGVVKICTIFKWIVSYNKTITIEVRLDVSPKDSL